MMKKSVIFLVILSLLLSLLCSCHKGEPLEPFELPESFDEDKQYEITFWAKNDGNNTQVEIYRNAISSFESYYPNIKVVLRSYTNYGDIYNDVITNIPTKTTPNVCITYPDHIATYITGQNSVVPLDELMADEEYGLGGSKVAFDSVKRDEIIPKFLSEGLIDGVQYALPYMRSTEACYINKTYVEKLGFEVPEVLTWDFIWQVSEAATEKNPDGTYKVNGKHVLIPFIYKSTDNMMIQYLRQADAGYSTEDGGVEIFNDDTKTFLKEIASHVSTGAFSTFKTKGYPANYLNRGECIFAIDSTAGATWMGSDAPLVDISEDTIVEFETEVRPIPQLNPESPEMISQGPSLCVFNKDDPNVVMASWLFAQFMLTNEVQISYSKTEGYTPVTSKALNSEEYQDYLSRSGEDNDEHYSIKIAATKLLLENIDKTFVTPVFNGSTSLRDAAGELIEKTLKGVTDKKTIDNAFFEYLYFDVALSNRLVQVSGPLPAGSVALLCCIGACWVGIIAYFIYEKIKEKKKTQ